LTAAFLPIACLLPALCLPSRFHNFRQFSGFAFDYYPNSACFRSDTPGCDVRSGVVMAFAFPSASVAEGFCLRSPTAYECARASMFGSLVDVAAYPLKPTY